VKITGGTLRGRTWPVKVGAGVRPTSARVREALFSAVGQDLSGWAVLDAFGGSGLLAAEAASRGADPVIVLERNSRAASRIGQAIHSFGLTIQLRRVDAMRVVGKESFDLVLMDPPYAEDPVAWLKRAESSALQIMVIETGGERRLPERVGDMVLDKTRRYGDTQLGIYWRSSLPEE
jgi:16S rRNA (guanine966-N2)-methyltransferase